MLVVSIVGIYITVGFTINTNDKVNSILDQITVDGGDEAERGGMALQLIDIRKTTDALKRKSNQRKKEASEDEDDEVFEVNFGEKREIKSIADYNLNLVLEDEDDFLMKIFRASALETKVCSSILNHYSSCLKTKEEEAEKDEDENKVFCLCEASFMQCTKIHDWCTESELKYFATHNILKKTCSNELAHDICGTYIKPATSS